MGSSEAVKVYRELMKAVKKHNIGKESEHYFRDFIKSEFTKGSQQKIQVAHDYTYLLNSVHYHQELLFSYNIAIDRTEEMKKVLGKSAASVGLQLPQVYQA